MNSIKFGKFHGFGNDYIVVEADDSAAENIGELTKRMCERHTGIGGDGIAVLGELDGTEADFSCRIINPDGGEAGFSGNGTRCAVAYLYHKNLWTRENLRLKMASGIKNYRLLSRENKTFWFRAEIGTPSGMANFDLRTANGETISIVELNVGNPVAAIFTDDFEAIDWRKIGAEIESHAHFPDRTNVVFVKINDRENIEIRIWERGAGETSSSGTCSIAAAVACVFTGKAAREISVHAVGGTTETVWREDGEMLLTGRADAVCDGEFFI